MSLRFVIMSAIRPPLILFRPASMPADASKSAMTKWKVLCRGSHVVQFADFLRSASAFIDIRQLRSSVTTGVFRIAGCFANVWLANVSICCGVASSGPFQKHGGRRRVLQQRIWPLFHPTEVFEPDAPEDDSGCNAAGLPPLPDRELCHEA